MPGQFGVFDSGTKFGFLPGSQVAGSALYGPQYQGVYGAVAPPDFLKVAQMESLRQEMGLKQDKFDLLKGFLNSYKPGNMFGTGSMSTSYPSLPTPNYVNAAPVWSQQQIDAQAGLQRAKLLGQAQSASRQFQQGLAGRGFSPLSPIGGFMEQNNLMQAASGAASNETNLNFNAAKANSDARLAAQGINSDLYGKYITALGNQRNTQADLDLKRMGMQYDLFNSILRGIM